MANKRKVVFGSRDWMANTRKVVFGSRDYYCLQDTIAIIDETQCVPPMNQHLRIDSVLFRRPLPHWLVPLSGRVLAGHPLMTTDKHQVWIRPCRDWCMSRHVTDTLILPKFTEIWTGVYNDQTPPQNRRHKCHSRALTLNRLAVNCDQCKWVAINANECHIGIHIGISIEYDRRNAQWTWHRIWAV